VSGDGVPRLDPSKLPATRNPAEIAEGVTTIDVLDYHAAGEPFRIVTAGLPEVPGASVLERRRYFRDRLDAVRRLLMWEPRGHADMYGGVLVPADSDDALCGVLFLHNEGYSTMCGHGTIALATALVEAGAVSVGEDGAARFAIDAPCGRLQIEARASAEDVAVAARDAYSPRVQEVAFENVPSFAAALDATLEVPGHGPVRFDVGYGGAFYAVLPAERLGLPLDRARMPELVRAARALVDAGRAALRRGGAEAGSLGIDHPENDLNFLYGAILTGSAEDPGHFDRNLCVFAEGEVDRSPTGSGVSARLAIQHARGATGVGDEVAVESILGREAVFHGRIVRTVEWGGRGAVVPEIRGSAHYVGSARYRLSPGDAIGRGFLLPR